MARCPNCDRETTRTRDWVCQWCGYPLPSGHFKKIDKTFFELKEERLSQQSDAEESETATEIESEPARETEPQPASESEPLPQAAPTTEVSPPEPATQQEVKTEPAPAAIEITVADLLAAYETEGEAANARFAGQILRVTGEIDKINVKEALDIYSLTLNSPRQSLLLQGVRCVFDRSHAPELNQLSAGQTVTVQGKYTGSMIDVSLRECSLVR